MKPWTISASVVAVIFFAAAISNEFYQLTSPLALSWHVLLRKMYSVIAFALVGYLMRRALAEHGRASVVVPCIVGIAAYSGAIEVVQAWLGSHEGFAWNAVDVACGAIGGALGSAGAARSPRGLTPRSVREPRQR